ncbi:MAG TPA: right-handed parallel beta-helix repeat-containing protein, partial [Ignavibacteriaceae bacterium]|nr:right-handed parallel beta-helix repeat-containing protein [Ignavibacteriaceae bacterium]
RWSGLCDFTILDGIILRDVTANDDLRGIWMRGDHNIIRNCELYRIKRTGIVVQGGYNMIEHNVVDGIIGGSNHKYRGNSISVESYYKAPDIRINCEYNVIQYNHFINNLTHAGINIFPATDDPRQPLMKGNKIYYNYVANIGAAVYVRYQVNLEIIGNIFVHSVQDTSYGSPGGAITFDQNRKMNPYPVPYDGGIIKIYKNTIANNTDYGIKNYNVNTLDLKNNVFIDSLSSNPKYLYLSFSYTAKDIKAEVDSNSYYGRGWWRWGVGTNQKNFEDWIKVSGQDKHGKYYP